MKSMTRAAALYRLLIAMVILMSLSGCGQSLNTEYGKSRGFSADKSLNGFGALRRTYQSRGWSDQDVSRLNDRLGSLDAIVWMPTQRDTLHENAVDWFEDWFLEAPRTLVYIVPDGGCEVEYFAAARSFAPPEQQIEYRRRVARLQNQQLIERIDNSSIPGNRWFGLERVAHQSRIGGQLGVWNDELSKSLAKDIGEACPVELTYKVIELSQLSSTTNPVTTSPSGTSTATTSVGVSTIDIEHEALLTAKDGSAAIVELTADEWGESKVIVVSNGSLLSNFSLTTPFGQKLASLLIDETGVAGGNAGFLTTDYLGAIVSDVDPEINAQSGMELFTVWPMSLIMLHLAVIGFVACMILLPIFGRPRESELASPNDFADHLDAVAALMSRSGGEDYARRRVSDYMRRIRGETSGQWVLAEPVPHATTTFHHQSSHLISGSASSTSGQSSMPSGELSAPAISSTKEKS